MTSFLRLTALALTLMSGLVGCVNEDLVLTAESVEIGVGEDSFAAVADGDVLERVWGGQGGSHVPGAAQLNGINVSGPGLGLALVSLEMTIEHEGGVVGGIGPLQVSVDPARGVLLEQTVFVEIDPWVTPFLYPEGWAERVEDWENPVSNEEGTAVEEGIREELAGGLTYRVAIEDGGGNVLVDEREVGLNY